MNLKSIGKLENEVTDDQNDGLRRDGDFLFLTRVKKSFVGQFYLKFLKPIPVFRRSALWVWTHFFPLFVSSAFWIRTQLPIMLFRLKTFMLGFTYVFRAFFPGLLKRKSLQERVRWIFGRFRLREQLLQRRLGSRRRPLLRLAMYIKSHEVPVYDVFPAAEVATPAPLVLPGLAGSVLVSPHLSYQFPSIYIAALKGCIVHGGTNMIQVFKGFLCHDIFDPDRDYTSEERHGRFVLTRNKRHVIWLADDAEVLLLDEAASFIDACAPNYAHWLTEVLPRITLFCAEQKFRHVPLVVNAGLHPNILASIKAVCHDDRTIYQLPVDLSIKVRKLYVVSVAGYVPYERRTRGTIGHSHGKFSPDAFALVRERVWDSVAEQACAGLHKKIYIRRNSGARKVTNAAEVEQCLIGQGFHVVEPEKLSFEEQVALFRQAEIVVASSGAAAANLIFCKPTVKFLILIGINEETSYWYWQNMARASGFSITYVLGKQTESGIHSDFQISLSALIEGVISHGKQNSPNCNH